MSVPIDLAGRKSVLIVKMSSIGDVVHALPVAVALRRRYPTLRISWVAEDWTAPLLQGHPAIDRIIRLPPMRWRRLSPEWVRSFANAMRTLRSESYDLSIDLQGLMKSAVVALSSRARRRIGAHGQREGAYLVSRPLPPPSGHLHVVEDYLRCAEFAGASPTPVAFSLPVQQEAVVRIDRKLSEIGIAAEAPLIVINPSASAAWKTWALREWAHVAGAVSHNGTTILVGDPAQRARHAELTRQATRPLYDLTGRTTLAELIALLDRCTVHIAPDTGSAHIAAALGRPVIGVYGPTPAWRKAPYGYADLVVSGDGQCGPSCPRFCLRGRPCLPDAEAVIARARHVLARAAPARAQGSGHEAR